jgi:hypothetical protein
MFINKHILWEALCSNNSKQGQIIDDKTETLTPCFVDTFILFPSYLTLLLICVYYFASQPSLTRYFKHRTLTIIRIISLLLVLTSISIIIKRYFVINEETLGAISIITDTTRFLSLSSLFIVILNKNLFIKISIPPPLLISLLYLQFSSVIQMVNYLYFLPSIFTNGVPSKYNLNKSQSLNLLFLFSINIQLLLIEVLIIVNWFYKTWRIDRKLRNQNLIYFESEKRDCISFIN